MTLSYFSIHTVVLEDTSPLSDPVAVQVSGPLEAVPEALSGAGAVQCPCSLLIPDVTQHFCLSSVALISIYFLHVCRASI